METAATDTDRTAVVAALADVSDTEIAALIAATGLLAWIESACDRELNRRLDFDYPLLPPEAAIDPSEDAVSIARLSSCVPNSPRTHRRCERSSMR